MRCLLIILLLGVSNPLHTQDTLHIPTSELEEFFLSLDTLRTQDSIKTTLISDLEAEIVLYNTLSHQDSLITQYKDQEIQLLNNQINLYIERLNQVDKWYNKPWVGVTGGFLGTIILIRVIDYTLPNE
tara:strand:+ start:1021 stop:1404 length:384 start_codon:yes stop_codon:yes gene_type:complete